MRTVIDVHAHIYPDVLAEKASSSIGRFYNFPMEMNGTVESLLRANREAGIARSVVHSVAVTPKQVHHVNDFLMRTAAEHPEEFIGFGSIHPEMEGLEAELDRIQKGGLKGIKLHPDFQLFYADDDKAVQMFRAIAERKLPVIVHIGDINRPYSEPQRFARVLDAVPKLRAVCAHFGGWSVWREGWKYLASRENAWVDTSSSLYALTPEEAVELIHRFGSKRVFFGTDYPMWNPKGELARLLSLPLSEEEKEDILHRNLEAFLKTEA